MPRPFRFVPLVLALALGAAVPIASQVPSEDRGTSGAWQAILKLTTTASAMHTMAHPDDEHGGMVARLSRRDGVRMAMLQLNRGESGDNAIGDELFDGLGLIRTEELLVADRYYGTDRQYFTTVIDYGFSKRLEEAFDKWGRDDVLRDVVRLVRMNRPWVLISRFQGNERDGHGNHQTAGVVTRLAFEAAGDPSRFPEQIAEGLRPWKPFKIYVGVRDDQPWNLRIDTGEPSPWLGDSYENFARYGLSFQRSQNGGQYFPRFGPSYGLYERVGARVPVAEKESGFFEGIDTTIPALFKTLGTPAPAGAEAALARIDASVKAAMRAFSITDPSAAAAPLAEGLTATREALTLSAGEPEAAFVLGIKEQQFQDAITAALGLELSAFARPAGVPEPTGPFAAFAPPPVMGNVVPGDSFEIRASLVNRARVPIQVSEIALDTPDAWTARPTSNPAGPLELNDVAERRFDVTLSPKAALGSRPYFHRASLRENHYTLDDPSQFGRPAREPAATAVVRYTVSGVPVTVRSVVQRRESRRPFGYATLELQVVPAVSVQVGPTSAIVPLEAARKSVTLSVDLLNNRASGLKGIVAPRLPAGWTATPPSHDFSFARAGERAAFQFEVTLPSIDSKPYAVTVVATANGTEFTEGYQVIEHRDLETRYLYRPSTTEVRGIDVKTVSGLHVGYVMGIGDQVPDGIAQLGYDVTLLDEAALASGDLSRFDAIMTGTRAYAVRKDLVTYNQRLLDYARNGGNLIVLYNTQELDPKQFAPYPGELTQRAEEVSEEDSPVQILAPSNQAFTWPNRITTADFDGWVEQRGSKFWATWDERYTPMIETHDIGQDPQRGGWLSAPYGKGHYTYFAYAFHRQLPYGVPGAYRLLANVLALNKAP
ncbi:MAG: PIG-L family deacetylase [Vicinamibacterales bacterium]